MKKHSVANGMNDVFFVTA